MDPIGSAFSNTADGGVRRSGFDQSYEQRSKPSTSSRGSVLGLGSRSLSIAPTISFTIASVVVRQRADFSRAIHVRHERQPKDVA